MLWAEDFTGFDVVAALGSQKIVLFRDLGVV